MTSIHNSVIKHLLQGGLSPILRAHRKRARYGLMCLYSENREVEMEHLWDLMDSSLPNLSSPRPTKDPVSKKFLKKQNRV